MPLRLLAIVILLTAATDSVQAQGVPPFSYLAIAGGPQPHFREDDLRRRWLFDSEGEVFLTTPILYGQLEFGASAHHFRPRSEHVPEFDAFLGYIAWDVGVRYPKGVRLAAGPRIGMYIMDFDVETFSGAQTEAEMTVGAHARITVHPLPYIGLYAAVSRMHTFTHVPLTMHFASAGVVLSVKSPGWLRRVLE